MKPTVLLDMDGPLADFDRAFFERCAWNGWEMDCTLATQTHRFATDHIPNRAARAHARRMVDTTGWFASLPVTAGARNGLLSLAEVADVWIVSKPLEANPSCRDEKAEWLRREFGTEWERRLILAADKSMVRGDVLLDDAPHVEWCERATWVPVIFATPWNGAGSKWESLRRWTWRDPIERLLDAEEQPLQRAGQVPNGESS